MIVTQRLCLEPLTPEHAAEMFAGLRDETAYHFIPDEPPDSVTVLESRYARLSTGKSPDGSEIWLNWIVKRRERAKAIGYVQATVTEADGTMLIAYHLFPPFWDHGYAREAVCAMLNHCQDTYRLREARAYIDTRNLRSLRLVEALGFQREAVIPGADFFRGRVSDEYVYHRRLT